MFMDIFSLWPSWRYGCQISRFMASLALALFFGLCGVFGVLHDGGDISTMVWYLLHGGAVRWLLGELLGGGGIWLSGCMVGGRLTLLIIHDAFR